MKTADERMEAIYGGGWQDLMACVKAIQVVYNNLKEMQAEIDILEDSNETFKILEKVSLEYNQKAKDFLKKQRFLSIEEVNNYHYSLICRKNADTPTVGYLQEILVTDIVDELLQKIDRLQYEKDEAVKRLLGYQEMVHNG